MKKLLIFLLSAIALQSFGQTVIRMSATASGTNTYSTTFNPTVSIFNQSTIYVIPFANANSSGTVTVDPDAGGAGSAVAIKGADGNDIEIGAIVSGGTYSFKFNGTVLRMIGAWEQDAGGGSSTFVGLTDGPGSFTGNTLRFMRVNAGETALEYRTPANVLSDIGAQAALVSGTNIKTINGTTLLGSGDIALLGKIFPFSVTDEVIPITTGTGVLSFRIPYGMTLTGIRASLVTAQTSGSILTIDINESGTTILSTKLTIDNTETTSVSAATPAVISDAAIADDAVITIDIDGVDAATTAAGLKITLYGN